MPRSIAIHALVLASVLAAVAGCARGTQTRQAAVPSPPPPAVAQLASLEIEYPDAHTESDSDLRQSLPPLDMTELPEFWDVHLQEVVHLALENSRVFRDLGGRVLQEPAAAVTVFDPAIQETDPRFGVAAALSEFDASLSASAFFEKNDRALNNIFEGGGTRLFQQDLNVYQLELSKRTAVGTELSLRNISEYDYNNAPGNNVPNLPWGDRLEMSFRQPLLQGAGAVFNRIVGQQGTPGFYNGVMIARINSDVALADFEESVQELVSQVENAYWELYFAYRDLDAKIDARNRAQQTWQQVHALYLTGQRGGEAEQEWQAREQYYRFEADVQDALMGRVVTVSPTDSLPGRGGVYVAERQLRSIAGLAANDGRLMRPTDEPSMAEVVFDWQQAVNESLDRRVELRRQKWIVTRREMELIAARSYLLPQLDAVGGYRFRGLGHDLLRSDRSPDPFDNAIQNLTSGDFQEWQLGIDLNVPLGYRRAHAAVRNAELQLSRARAVLREQEQQVVNDLTGAFAETKRSRRLAQTNYNRQLAAREQLMALEAVYQDADESEKLRLLDLLLDAQRRLAEAESNFHRSESEYAVAIKNVHLEKGSMLDFNEIHLAESVSPHAAYHDAARTRRSERPRPRLNAHVPQRGPFVSRGVVAQEFGPHAVEADLDWQPGGSADGAVETLPSP